MRVAATLQLLETNGVARVVNIRPTLPLISERVYEVVVIAGDLVNGTGGVIGSEAVARSAPTSVKTPRQRGPTLPCSTEALASQLERRAPMG